MCNDLNDSQISMIRNFLDFIAKCENDGVEKSDLFNGMAWFFVGMCKSVQMSHDQMLKYMLKLYHEPSSFKKVFDKYGG